MTGSSHENNVIVCHWEGRKTSQELVLLSLNFNKKGGRMAEKEKAKLFALLAVEPDLSKACKSIINEASKTLGKREFFTGSEKKLRMFDDQVESTFPVEHQKMTTTVNEKLAYVEPFIIKYWDAVYQKDLTNCTAKADLVLDGKVVAKDVPATFLLGLEAKLKNLRDLYLTIPTLGSGIDWEIAKNLGDDVYKRVTPEESTKTQTGFRAIVLYHAKFPKEGERGESQPAQVEKISETKDIGMYEKQVWSGMLSPADKSKLIGRIDTAMMSVKDARSRANSVPVVNGEVTKELFDFVHNRGKFE
jgi:hypothetical protein